MRRFIAASVLTFATAAGVLTAVGTANAVVPPNPCPVRPLVSVNSAGQIVITVGCDSGSI